MSIFEAKTWVWGQKQGSPNIPNIRKIQNLFYSKLSQNYGKMTLKSSFGNREKLVPTKTFECKFGMQGLISDTYFFVILGKNLLHINKIKCYDVDKCEKKLQI